MISPSPTFSERMNRPDDPESSTASAPLLYGRVVSVMSCASFKGVPGGATRSDMVWLVGIALLWGVRGGELGRAEGEGEKPKPKTFTRELVWGALLLGFLRK